MAPLDDGPRHASTEWHEDQAVVTIMPRDKGLRHLLVVDDDDRIRSLLRQYLERAGFRVTTAEDARGARRLLELFDIDLMVLDVMMPGESGFELTRWLRAQPGFKGRTPVLLLTARGLSEDRIEGLTLGADDYLPKPFEPQELTLRIEAILRRISERPGAAAVLSLGRCQFDMERGELTCEGEHVRLTEAETQLLRTLGLSANAPVERLALARGDSEGAGRAVDIQVTRLRRKIEADPKNPRYLQTVRGVGYMLAPDP
jgi:two-component system phosphate regulon response regulator OmpR